MKMILSCLVVLCVLLTSCVAVQPVPANDGTSTAEPMEDATPTEGSASTEAVAETGAYLRENLGESLVEIIDVDTLENDLVAYLLSDSDDGETNEMAG